MNDELKVGFILEVNDSDSPPKKKKPTPKRKAQDDPHPLYKKTKRKLKGMKATELHAILQKDVFTFCQDQGLMPKSVKCSCDADMRLQRHKNDQRVWSCQKNGHAKRHGMRKGTFFENSHMPIPDILFIMYMWMHRYSTGLMMHECNNGPNSIIGWSRRCVELCQLILELKNEPLGGEQKVVELFECKFNDPKTCKGDEDRWAFCVLEQDSTKSLLIIVEDKTSDSIRQIFSKYFLPGTLIVTIFWSPYTNLSKKDFRHLTKELSMSFYDPTTKVTMDTYDAFVKVVNRHQPLTHLVKNEYESSFFEMMYRKSLANAPDAYLAFLKDVALVYKPQDVVIKTEPNTNDDD